MPMNVTFERAQKEEKLKIDCNKLNEGMQNSAE